MKKSAFIICLLSSALCPLSSRSATNVYLDVTAAELNARIAQIPTNTANISNNTATITAITNTAYSAGLADVWFGNQVISAAFTNAAYATNDLSAYVGTKVVQVTLQFKGLAATTVSLRTAGDTNTVDDTSINSVAIASGATANMTCLTDASGQVEVKATGNTSMTLISFIRRHEFD